MTAITDQLYHNLGGANPASPVTVSAASWKVEAQAGELLAAMRPVSTPMPVPLPAPVYISQWSDEASARINDCGPTCVMMLLRPRGDKTPINALRTDEPTGLTDAVALQAMLKTHSVESSLDKLSPMGDLQALVRPYSILLINYAPIARYGQDAGFKGWHWLIFLGPDPANPANVIVNDPDYWGNRIAEGDHKSLPASALRSAFQPYPGTSFCTAIGIPDIGGPLPQPALFTPHDVIITNNAAPWLNIRAGAGTGYAKIGKALPGERYRVVAESLGWMRLDGAAERWISALFTTPSPTPPLSAPPPSQQTASKAAIHFQTGGDKNGLLDILRTGKIHGVLNMRVGRDNDLTATEVKAIGGNIEVCERFWFDDKTSPSGRNFVPDWSKHDLRQVGYDWCKEYFDTFKIDHKSEWHQIINEPGWGPGTASFWMGAIDYAETINVNLGLLCISNGNPPLPYEVQRNDYREFWIDPEILAMLRRGKQHGDVMLLHQYVLPQEQGLPWTDDWCVARHKRVHDVLPDDLKDMGLIIGELGDTHGTAYGNQHYADNVKQWLALVSNDIYLRWGAWWTWGAVNEGQWGKDKIEGAKVEIAAAL